MKDFIRKLNSKLQTEKLSQTVTTLLFRPSSQLCPLRLIYSEDVFSLVFGTVAHNKNKKENVYLLLTEFEGRTVSYGPSFSRSLMAALARSARAINRREKTRIRNLQYRPRKRG